MRIYEKIETVKDALSVIKKHEEKMQKSIKDFSHYKKIGFFYMEAVAYLENAGLNPKTPNNKEYNIWDINIIISADCVEFNDDMRDFIEKKLKGIRGEIIGIESLKVEVDTALVGDPYRLLLSVYAEKE